MIFLSFLLGIILAPFLELVVSKFKHAKLSIVENKQLENISILDPLSDWDNRFKERLNGSNK